MLGNFGKLFFLILLMIVIGAGIDFGMENTEKVSLKFFSFETLSLPLWMIVMISVVIGAVLMMIFFLPEIMKLSIANTKMRRRLAKLNDEETSENVPE